MFYIKIEKALLTSCFLSRFVLVCGAVFADTATILPFWRMGNRCILIHRNVFWPNAQGVICLQCCRISLCSNWGEASEKKPGGGEKYCWQNLAGKTYKKLHPAETHKMCSSFWAFCIRDLWKHGIAYPQIKWDSWSLASFTLVFWRLQ